MVGSGYLLRGRRGGFLPEAPSPPHLKCKTQNTKEGKAAIERWGAAEAEGEKGGRQSERKINF